MNRWDEHLIGTYYYVRHQHVWKGNPDPKLKTADIISWKKNSPGFLRKMQLARAKKGTK